VRQTSETLTRWKADCAAFAAEALRVPLWDHQAEVVRDPRPFKAICAARQTGKSLLFAVVAIWTAFARPGSTSLVISATEDAAKRLFRQIRDIAEGSPLLAGSVADSTASRMRLTNGSEIICLPSSEKQVRGYTVDGVLILDEAAFMDGALWRAALYTVAAVAKPQVYMGSTPWGSREHFFRQVWEDGRAGSQDWAAFQWRYEVSPLINKELLEREKERTDPLTYRAEVLGEWVDDAEAYFTYEEIMAAVADFPMIPPEEARGMRAIAGIDWGVRYDSNVLVVAVPVVDPYLNPGLKPPIWLVSWIEEHPAGSGGYLPFVERVASTSLWDHRRRNPYGTHEGYDLIAVFSETNGPGEAPTELLAQKWRQTIRRGQTRRGVAGIATTQAYKQEAYGKMKLLMEQGRLILPRHPGLMKQLSHLRATFTPSGRLSIEADSPAIHDDIADAFMHCTAAIAYQSDYMAAADPDATPQIPEGREIITSGRGVRIAWPLRRIDYAPGRPIRKPKGW